MTTGTGRTPRLYAGPDLERAAALSRVPGPLATRLAGARNLAAVALDVVRTRLADGGGTGYETVLAEGVTAAGARATAVYAGTGASAGWCFERVFERVEHTRRSAGQAAAAARAALAAALPEVRVAFIEGLPPAGLPRLAFPWIPLPAWVKQRLRVVSDWPAQLGALRRGTRQEVARYLRREGYRCRLTREPAAQASFYERLYAPWIARRFGDAGLIVDRRRFLAECRRGVILELLRGEAVVGAALLRPLGRSLAVVWSALDPAAGPLRGASDTLDYFSLLYASQSGCRWLDLGPSRPDLHDGILRYKAKWGCELYAGRVPQARILVGCNGEGPVETAFLERQAFVLREGRALRALLFAGAGTDAAALRERLEAVRTAGVRDYRVVDLAGAPERLRPALAHPDVTLARPDTLLPLP